MAGALFVQVPADRPSEQALRAIKALTDEYKQGLVNACSEEVAPGEPPDLHYEELALQVAVISQEGAIMARRLASERGPNAAFYMHKDAAQYRLQAYACNPLREHLVSSRRYIAEAQRFLDGSAITPAAREALETMSQIVAAKLKAHDERLASETNILLPVKKGNPVTVPKRPPLSTAPQRENLVSSASEAAAAAHHSAPTELPPPAKRRDRPMVSRGERIALAVSGSLTGLFFGAALGMGLSRVRDPFEGPAHRAISDAVKASWKDGVKVPYGKGVDMCRGGRDLEAAGVIGACERFEGLGRATIATGVLAAVSLATTIVVAARIVRKRNRRMHVAAEWRSGGMVLNLSGRF